MLGPINGLIVWKTGVDAFIVTLGAMLGFRGLVFMYNGEQPTSHLNWTLVDFAEAQFLGLHTATWFLLGHGARAVVDDDRRCTAATPTPSATTARRR